MNDALLRWSEEVKSSEFEAASLGTDVTNLQHQIDDLTHAIRDLGTFRFNDDTEDYEILTKAEALWQLVSNSVASIRQTISSAASEAHDLRRAAEFYKSNRP